MRLRHAVKLQRHWQQVAAHLGQQVQVNAPQPPFSWRRMVPTFQMSLFQLVDARGSVALTVTPPDAIANVTFLHRNGEYA